MTLSCSTRTHLNSMAQPLTFGVPLILTCYIRYQRSSLSSARSETRCSANLKFRFVSCATRYSIQPLISIAVLCRPCTMKTTMIQAQLTHVSISEESPHARNLLPVPSRCAQKVWVQANKFFKFAKGLEARPPQATTAKKDQ